ncbi:TPA: hypothetical protein ACGR4R_003115 [Aeromonas veronii]|uniref:Uncharacterized protein n=1 Tax=Aeromonas veronii TaxID=654 RepID=A0AAX2UPA6_AERVE|nr:MULTISPECIES: hypothetical protein [Aeromonas]MBS4705226.1 hypothetical protein [Aeromonas veronii]MCF5728953.1 hypothetical protein [Aeromonas veronii]MDM5056540.1 hypothetical protein [Aeromonas dhakensis]MDM5082697.1 hypothetical protein [Aeromonas dhakensis]QWL60597.1 hypothetical protein HQ400_21220 [Aeromonas jandaei]
MKHPYYPIELFRSGFYFFTGPYQRVLDFLAPRLKERDWEITRDDLQDCGGYCMSFTTPNGVANLIWVPDVEDEFVLFHEALHCSFNILRRVGVPADADSQEAIAYLQEEVVKGCRKVAKTFKYKDPIKAERGDGQSVVASAHRISKGGF